MSIMVSELQRIHASMEIGEEFGVDENLDEESGSMLPEEPGFGVETEDDESV